MGEHQDAVAFFLKEAAVRFAFLEEAGFTRQTFKQVGGYVQGHYYVGRHICIEVQIELRELEPWVYLCLLVDGKPTEDLWNDASGRRVRTSLGEQLIRVGLQPRQPPKTKRRPKRRTELSNEQLILERLDKTAELMRAHPGLYTDRPDLLDKPGKLA